MLFNFWQNSIPTFPRESCQKVSGSCIFLIKHQVGGNLKVGQMTNWSIVSTCFCSARTCRWYSNNVAQNFAKQGPGDDPLQSLAIWLPRAFQHRVATTATAETLNWTTYHSSGQGPACIMDFLEIFSRYWKCIISDQYWQQIFGLCSNKIGQWQTHAYICQYLA